MGAGRWFLHEHPRDANSWDDPIVEAVDSLPGVFLVRGDMCAWGLELAGDAATAFILTSLFGSFTKAQ